MDQEQELKLREQVQMGVRARDAMLFLLPVLEQIRADTMRRIELPAAQMGLQENLLDCRAAMVGCRKVQDSINNLINAGKIAEDELQKE